MDKIQQLMGMLTMMKSMGSMKGGGGGGWGMCNFEVVPAPVRED